MTDFVPDDELEPTFRLMLRRLRAAREGSAEYRMIERQIEGVRNSSELAGMVYEDCAWYSRY